MTKRNVEISLKSLWVKNNGEDSQGKAGNHNLTVELLFPTTGRSTVLYNKGGLKLKDDETINFETVKDEETNKLKYDYFDRIMFKEEILEQAKIKVLLTHSEKPEGYEIFITNVLSSLISLGNNLLPGIVSKISDAVKSTAEELKDEEKEKQKGIYTIGEASRILTVAELETLEPGQSLGLTFKLKVPEDIQKETLKFVPPDESPKPVRELVTILEKSKDENDHNGVLTLNLKMLD